jgi:broad specificity phosphatase PhoE
MTNSLTNNININDKNNDRIEYKIKLQDLNYKGRLETSKYFSYFKKNKVNYIYSSDYKSTIETAKIIFPKRNIIIDKSLTNMRMGITRLSELPSYYFEQHFLDNNYKLSGGESQEDIRQRMLNFINKMLIKHKDKTIVLFTHKSNITYLLRIWCYIKYNDSFFFNQNKIFNGQYRLPELFKLEFKENELVDICYINKQSN